MIQESSLNTHCSRCQGRQRSILRRSELVLLSPVLLGLQGVMQAFCEACGERLFVAPQERARILEALRDSPLPWSLGEEIERKGYKNGLRGMRAQLRTLCGEDADLRIGVGVNLRTAEIDLLLHAYSGGEIGAETATLQRALGEFLQWYRSETPLPSLRGVELRCHLGCAEAYEAHDQPFARSEVPQ